MVRRRVLVACGGMPFPGTEGIREAAERLDDADPNYYGTSNATVEGARKKESKEALVRRAVDKRLHKFWGKLVAPLDAYRARLAICMC